MTKVQLTNFSQKKKHYDDGMKRNGANLPMFFLLMFSLEPISGGFHQDYLNSQYIQRNFLRNQSGIKTVRVKKGIKTRHKQKLQLRQ